MSNFRVNSHSRQKCVKFSHCFSYVIMHLDQLQAGMRIGNRKKGGKSADDIASANGFLFGPFLVGDLKGVILHIST